MGFRGGWVLFVSFGLEVEGGFDKILGGFFFCGGGIFF